MHIDKKIWIDVETTGFSAKKHDIWQIAILLDVNRELVSKEVFNFQPADWDSISDKALEVTGMDREKLKTFPPLSIAVPLVIKYLQECVDHGPDSVLGVFSGHNTEFDWKFVRAFLEKHTRERMKDFFVIDFPIDTKKIAKDLGLVKKKLISNHKLQTLTEYYKVEHKAHDALSDILATREIYYLMGGHIDKS